MNFSVDTAVKGVRLVLAAGRTWRFRDADVPSAPVRFPGDPVILACWHEYLLGFALLGRDRGIASLASRHGDGEIISRVVAPLGFVMARGSSSRGGSTGFRGLARAAKAGRSIYLTVDGPRGPRHHCQPGVVRLAAQSGHPIVPMAMAATTCLRARSWDRFVIPALGTRIFVAFGDPIFVERSVADEKGILRTLETAMSRQVARCETAAAEARDGYTYATRSAETSAPPAVRKGPIVAIERRVEHRLRRSWLRPNPPLDLRAAATVFAGVRATRRGLYSAGVIQPRRASLPVVSVGGLTVGGSGKTPLVTELAGWLLDAGHRPAVLTRGYLDELRLHRESRPEAIVLGHPDRFAIARRAASRGATVALLDDGFQHLALARDIDVLAIDRDALRRTNGRSLPAGPFRDSVTAGLERADAVVLVGREPWTEDVATFERQWIARFAADRRVSSLSIESGPPKRINPGGEHPTVALTGVMKPNLFFDFVRTQCPGLTHEHALPDHGSPGDEWPGLLQAAQAGGFVMTRKDYMRFGADVPTGIGVWVVPERLEWRSGRAELAALVLEAVGQAPKC